MKGYDTRCEKCRSPRPCPVRWMRDGLWVGRCCKEKGDKLRELENKRRQMVLFGGGRR